MKGSRRGIPLGPLGGASRASKRWTERLVLGESCESELTSGVLQSNHITVFTINVVPCETTPRASDLGRLGFEPVNER